MKRPFKNVTDKMTHAKLGRKIDDWNAIKTCAIKRLPFMGSRWEDGNPTLYCIGMLGEQD